MHGGEARETASRGTADTDAGALAPVAPAWNTLLLVVLVAATSLAGYASTRRLPPAGAPRVANYCITAVWEWTLAGLGYWGLRLRQTPLRQILGVRRGGASGWLGDFGVAMVFWLVAVLVLGALALLIKPLGADPEAIRSVVTKLAPGTPLELALWVGMSMTAGVCEEFLFRGYLQQQFTAWTRHAWVGLVCSAALFGLAHSYEGVAGMVLIAVYGALFGVLARVRRSLRAGMLAHSWHDALSGFALFAAHHYAGRLPR